MKDPYYPDDIRQYDNYPGSPFYNDPYEALEDCSYSDLELIAAERDDPVIEEVMSERPDPEYAELFTALDLEKKYPHYEIWDDQFYNLQVLSENSVFPERAEHMHYADLSTNPLICYHPYWTQAVAPTWTPSRSAELVRRNYRERKALLYDI